AGNPVPVATVVLVALLVVSGLQLLLFAMWFDMESNRGLSHGGLQQGRPLELPAGARVVLVYDGAQEPLPATEAVASVAQNR
ncbi:MAG: hypothetical protein ACRDNI_00485, partial [Gaiellaceae bacterium]